MAQEGTDKTVRKEHKIEAKMVHAIKKMAKNLRSGYCTFLNNLNNMLQSKSKGGAGNVRVGGFFSF